jgi:lipase
MTSAPESVSYDVDGGSLHALRWGAPDAPASRTVLAVHGITASAMAWPAVAAALPDDWAMVAVDVRGRGLSRDLPGPAGMRRHAADVHAVARALGDPSELVLAGHSMGAYLSLLAVDEQPELFRRLVLVDGAVPLPVPEGVDLDEVLDASLGPALARLRVTYADVDAYLDFYRAHPALGPHWSATVEDYVRYDAMPVEGGVRSRAVEELVRTDGRDLLALPDELDAALRRLRVPTVLLAAPKGMFGQEPGMLPADAVTAYDEQVDALTAEVVPDVNHYTILFDPAAAARVAAAITG